MGGERFLQQGNKVSLMAEEVEATTLTYSNGEWIWGSVGLQDSVLKDDGVALQKYLWIVDPIYSALVMQCVTAWDALWLSTGGKRPEQDDPLLLEAQDIERKTNEYFKDNIEKYRKDFLKLMENPYK